MEESHNPHPARGLIHILTSRKKPTMMSQPTPRKGIDTVNRLEVE